MAPSTTSKSCPAIRPGETVTFVPRSRRKLTRLLPCSIPVYNYPVSPQTRDLDAPANPSSRPQVVIEAVDEDQVRSCEHTVIKWSGGAPPYTIWGKTILANVAASLADLFRDHSRLGLGQQGLGRPCIVPSRHRARHDQRHVLRMACQLPSSRCGRLHRSREPLLAPRRCSSAFADFVHLGAVG